MTTIHIPRTARMCMISAFLALMAFFFLAFGSASAHTLNNSAHAAQTTSSTTTVVTRIISNPSTVFSPSTLAVKSGTHVKIVNKTAFTKILFTSGGIVRLAPNGTMTITVTQSQDVGICGGGTLIITVT